MAATFTMNVTLSPENEYSAFINCDFVGVYIILVNSERKKGSHGIFHIGSSSEGSKSVKRTVTTSGDCGEKLDIVWPQNSAPILCYVSDHHAPREPRHYNLKII